MDKVKRILKLNPILNKELRLGSRSIKIPMFVMGYDIVLAMIAVIAMAALGFTGQSGQMDFAGYLSIYQIIGWTQFFITLLIVPVLTAGTISGERERQTLDIMLTTPKKPISIIWGKLLAALSNYMIFLISSIPIMAIAFILGGLNWFALLGYLVMMMLTAVYLGSVGVFCSAAFKRTIASVVMTFLIAFALFVVPYVLFFTIYGVAYGIYEYQYEYLRNAVTYPDFNVGLLPMLLLLNPASGFFDYMMQTMSLTSIHEILEDVDSFGIIMPILAYAWIPMNVIVSAAVSCFFIWRASVKLNPLKKPKKRKAGPTGSSAPSFPVQPTPAKPTPQLYQPSPMPGDRTDSAVQTAPPVQTPPTSSSEADTEKLIGGV